LSAVVVTSSKLLTAFACFELTWFCYERLQDWTTIHLSDARTSHLRTLSKIVGIGLSASSLFASFPSPPKRPREPHIIG